KGHAQVATARPHMRSAAQGLVWEHREVQMTDQLKMRAWRLVALFTFSLVAVTIEDVFAVAPPKYLGNVDLYGDELTRGAVLRFGSKRMVAAWESLMFFADGKVAGIAGGDLALYDYHRTHSLSVLSPDKPAGIATCLVAPSTQTVIAGDYLYNRFALPGAP